MSRRPANGTGIALRERSWRLTVLVAGAMLVGLASGVPSASATLVGEVAEGVGSTVESVEAIPNATPVPSAIPPAPPPAAPQAPPPVQTEVVPMPSPSPSHSPGNVPAGDGTAGTAKDAVGSVASSGTEAPQQKAASVGTEGSRVSAFPDGSAPVPANATSRATVGGAPPSIVAAEVAPLHRWLARIWPAIALGAGADRGWLAGMTVNLLRPAAVATARVLSLTPPVTPVHREPRPVGQHETASVSQSALPDGPVSVDGERLVYLVAFAALLAVLAFTIWREFRSALRPGVR